MDAVPHFERYVLLSNAFKIAPWKIELAWVAPWVVATGLLVGWMVVQAWSTRRWSWWAFAVLCGLLAASPDLGKFLLPQHHVVNAVHGAMHAAHDWGYSLHSEIYHDGKTFPPAEIGRSPVAWLGFLAEIGVEAALFWVGVAVLAFAWGKVKTDEAERAGQPAESEE